MPMPTQLTIDQEQEQERDRAEVTRRQEAVDRWRTPPAEAPHSDRGESTGVPAVSTGNGGFV